VRLTWPLTGRLEEKRTIEAALSAPDLSGVLVCGAAGVGKSRIAREAVSAASSRGCESRWAVGTTSARKVPLGAFAPWATSTGGDRLQLVRDVIESVTAAPPGRTVILGVDDVQLLDELSTFVLHQIVQRDAAKVVLTLRDGEQIPAEVHEIWKGGQFDRLDVQPLSVDEIAELLSAALDGPVEPDVVNRLWKLTRGNALYLRNIVEQEVADRRIEQRSGVWRWIGDPIMPNGLVEAIESRFGTLATPVRDVIDVLAIGEPLELSVLRRIVDPDAIEEADVRGLITVDEVETGIEVRVAHPLYGEVRRLRAPATTLRRLRGLVATELAAAGEGDIRAEVRRATLLLESDLRPDVDLLLKAANGAIWLGDLRLAERLAETAIRAGAGAEAYFIRAHALSWLFAAPEADEVLAHMPTAGLTDDERARLAYLRASNALWALGDPARAKKIIDEAATSTPPGARTWIDAFLTIYSFAMDQPDAALEASRSLVLEDLPPVVGAETSWALTVITSDAGRTSDAETVANTGYAVASRAFDSPHMRFNIADAHVSALLLAGRMDDALTVAENVRCQAAEMFGAAELLGAAVAGRAELAAGRLDTACALLQRTAPALVASGHALGWGYRYRIPLATAFAMRGATAEAAAVLTALAQVQRTYRMLDYERSLAEAWVAANEGAVSEAIQMMLSAAQTCGSRGQFAAEVMCLQTAVQFGDHSGASRLAELESIVEGPRAGLAARFATSLRHRDGLELDALSTAFEEIGDLVAAVDAAAHAALVYRHRELPGKRLTSSAHADALAKQCGGINTPALCQVAEPMPLTGREREIVKLIATGMSTRQIADRLCLSVRTVEGHVYRAMTKTGTTTREELVALFKHYRPDS